MSTETLHSLVLDGHGGCREATAEEVAQGRSTEGLLWLHLDHSVDEASTWMRQRSGIDEVVVEALLAPSPRPRSLVSGAGLLVVLRGIHARDGAEPDEMVSVRIWLEQDRCITLRQRRLAAMTEVAGQLRAGHGPDDAGELLHEITERLLDRIEDVVQGIEDRTDDLEERVLTAEGRQVRTQLSDLRRQSIALRRYIAPQRDAIGRLHTERVPWMSELTRARLRESSDRITRYLETIDACRERAAVTYEELGNRLAEQMNHTMYILSVVAAIFLPLGLLTGLLGINVGGMPGADEPRAFAIVTVLLVVGGIAEWVWFKRRLF